MARFRRQFSLTSLCVIILAVALVCAWLPWPLALGLSVALLIPLFVSELTLAEIVFMAAIAFVLGALMTPIVSGPHNRKPRAVPVPIAPTSTTTGQGRIPKSGDPWSG